jgi:hypothetical protein
MADTWTLAPVIAPRAAEHPARPLVIGVPRRLSSAVQAQIAGLASPCAEAILRGGSPIDPREHPRQQPAAPAVDDGCGRGVTPERVGAPTGASIVPHEDAGMAGGKAQAFTRERMAGNTPPDLDRLFHAFPMTAGGKARRREFERVHALDSTVTSGA